MPPRTSWAGMTSPLGFLYLYPSVEIGDHPSFGSLKHWLMPGVVFTKRTAPFTVGSPTTVFVLPGPSFTISLSFLLGGSGSPLGPFGSFKRNCFVGFIWSAAMATIDAATTYPPRLRATMSWIMPTSLRVADDRRLV